MENFNHDLFQENLKKTWFKYMESFGQKQINEQESHLILEH